MVLHCPGTPRVAGCVCWLGALSDGLGYFLQKLRGLATLLSNPASCVRWLGKKISHRCRFYVGYNWWNCAFGGKDLGAHFLSACRCGPKRPTIAGYCGSAGRVSAAVARRLIINNYHLSCHSNSASTWPFHVCRRSTGWFLPAFSLATPTSSTGHF